MFRFLSFLALAFAVDATFAATPSKGAAPSQLQPLLIVTNEKDEFSLEGRFEGTFSVQSGFIEVNLTRASILLLGSASNQRPRLVTTIRLGLAHNTEGAQWHPSDYITLAAPNKVMKVGEAMQLAPGTFRIPVADARTLADKWFVVETANSFADVTKSNATKSGVCYAHSRRRIFAGLNLAGIPVTSTSITAPAVISGVAATSVPLGSNQPRPLLIVTNEGDNFALEGRFEGTYSIQPGFVEVNITRASLLNLGSPNFLGPRLVTGVRLSLAHLANGRWSSENYVPFATINQVMKVGETLQLPPRTIRIPLADASSLPQHWFVAETTYKLIDTAKPSPPQGSTCYAHSSRAIFASAN